MKIFLTGATGFIGMHLVPELLAHGHRVVGLTRGEGDSLARAGAEVLRGDVNDLALLRAAAADADGIIHAAYDHDLANAREHAENDRKVIALLGDAGRPLVIASGTGLAVRAGDAPAKETDPAVTSAAFPRAATEEAADALVAKGAHVVVLRLSQVHDTRKQGRVTWQIERARAQGRVAYVGEGTNRIAAVHVSDTVRLFRLALEHGRAGARYHAVAEEGIPMRAVAEAIGARLRLPVASLGPEEAAAYFGPLAKLAELDLAATSELTQRELSWTPTGPGLLADLGNLDQGSTMS